MPSDYDDEDIDGYRWHKEWDPDDRWEVEHLPRWRPMETVNLPEEDQR